MADRQNFSQKEEADKNRGGKHFYPQSYSYLDFILSNNRSCLDISFSLNSNNKAIQKIEGTIKHTIGSQIPILLTGNYSSGKTFIAKRIFEAEQKLSAGKLLLVDCGNFPTKEEGANLIKSLFSETSTALEGVRTLVLKEITLLDLQSQEYVLKFLQKTSSHGAEKVPRLIATSSEDIYKLVERSLFKQDLYYRLYVLQFKLPPFTERTEDLRNIISHILSDLNKEAQFNEIYPIVLAKMKSKKAFFLEKGIRGIVDCINEHYKSSMIPSADSICKTPFKSEQAYEDSSLWLKSIPKGMTLKSIETHMILETLKNHMGNRTHTARSLGISLRTLRNKINEYLQKGYPVTKPEKQ